MGVSICLKQNQRRRKMAAKFVFALVLVALALAHAEEPKVLAGLVPEAKVPEAVSEIIEAVTREKREAGDEEADADYLDEDDEESADEWQPVEDPAEDATAK